MTGLDVCCEIKVFVNKLNCSYRTGFYVRQKQELYVVHSLMPVKFLVYSLNICSDVNMPHGLHVCFDSDSTVPGKDLQ